MGGAWWTLGLAAALIAAVFVLAPVEAADDVWCVSLTSNTTATATPPTFPIDARGGGVVPNATVDAGSPCAASLGNDHCCASDALGRIEAGFATSSNATHAWATDYGVAGECCFDAVADLVCNTLCGVANAGWIGADSTEANLTVVVATEVCSTAWSACATRDAGSDAASAADFCTDLFGDGVFGFDVAIVFDNATAGGVWTTVEAQAALTAAGAPYDTINTTGAVVTPGAFNVSFGNDTGCTTWEPTTTTSAPSGNATTSTAAPTTTTAAPAGTGFDSGEAAETGLFGLKKGGGIALLLVILLGVLFLIIGIVAVSYLKYSGEPTAVGAAGSQQAPKKGKMGNKAKQAKKAKAKAKAKAKVSESSGTASSGSLSSGSGARRRGRRGSNSDSISSDR